MQKDTQRHIAGMLCGLMAFLWSGTAELLVSVAHASELQSEFKNQRQTIRNLELNATKAMIAASPACDAFEGKLNQLMASVATTTPVSVPSQSQGNSPSAKALGLDPAIAELIDGTPKLSALLDETYLVAQTCKPLYAKLTDAEAKLNNELNQWIDLANKINPTGVMGPRLEASGMWVAVKIRRATHKDMHTTLPDLSNTAACAGDVLTQQSIPNLFQGLANTESALVVKSLSEIIKQSQCMDIQQSVALDRGLSMGAVASILAFNSAADIPLRKHLLETLIIAGAPILEANKVLGPTGLWILTQSLLLKEKSHPDIWVLDNNSFLVSYGITVPSRDTAQAVTLPICAELPPAVASAKLDVFSQAESTPSPFDMKDNAAAGVFDFAKFFNTKPELPKVIVVNPEDAPLAYGYTIKELKAKICPVTPAFEPQAGMPMVGPLNKGLGDGCYNYKAEEITDSNRGDHLGYATCSLPDMIAKGRVCKTRLCDAPKLPQSGMPGFVNPFGGEMPTPSLGSSDCGFPVMQGIPPECQMAGKNAKVFANLTNNSGCGDFKQLNLVADPAKKPKPIVFEDMEIKGKVPQLIVFEEMEIKGKVPPGSGSAESQSSSSTSSDPENKAKPEKATKPETPQPSTPANQPVAPATGGTAASLPPSVTPAKDKKLWDQVNKALPPKSEAFPDDPIPSGIATEEEFIKAVEKEVALSAKVEQLEKVYDDASDAHTFNPCFANNKSPSCNSEEYEKITAKYKTAEDELYGAKLERLLLVYAIVHAPFRFTFQPIIDDKSLLENTQLLDQLQVKCANAVCSKKIHDLRAHIADSDYFKKRMKDAADDAKKAIGNAVVKKAIKDLRDKMLGKPMDNDLYDIAYEAMLNLVDISVVLDFNNNDTAAAYAEKNSIVSIVVPSFHINMPLENFYHNLVGTLIHEYILHVLSDFLAIYGYNFEGKAGEGDKASHPDHQLGIQLQDLTGIAMGYVSPPIGLVKTLIEDVYFRDYTGYKQYLPNSSSSSSNQTAGNFAGSGSGGSSQSGGNSGGNNSGNSGGGGTPNKDCAPDSPNCGGLSPCQLVTLAAVAKCDMASGKAGTKLIPGGGLTAPEPKLDKATADWLSCLFPKPATGYDKTDVFCSEIGGQIICTENTYHVPGKDNDTCQSMMCGEGYTPSQDPKTGTCSCKPVGVGGNAWEGYRGGSVNGCEMIICTDNSTHPCCMPSGARNRQALPRTRQPADVPERSPEADFPEQRHVPYQEYQERLPDQQATPPERGAEIPPAR